MSARLVVVDVPGTPVLVQVYRGAECISVPVSPLRALRLASDLIEAAEARLKAEGEINA